MNIQFGNLTTKEFEEKVGWKFEEKDRSFLEKHRTETADFSESDRFHIFDAPFSLTIGEDIAKQIIDILKKYNADKQPKTDFSVGVKINKPKDAKDENQAK